MADTSFPRSRRAILTAATGAAAATVVGALARPLPALAAGDDGSTITVGSTFIDIRSETYLSNAANNNTVLSGTSSSAGGHGGGIGLAGSSSFGVGVHGHSNLSAGVLGQSGTSSGVAGVSESGPGVTGRSNSGIGVWASSAHGFALLAESLNNDAVALQADGVTQFSRSGTLTVLAGKSKVSQAGLRIDPGTLVLAVLQQNRAGVWITSAVPNAARGSFTLHLNKTVSASTTVAWFLVN